jgi:HSP20 family protein
MKNQVVMAIAVGLLLALGIQAYMMFQLNNQVNQLTEQIKPSNNVSVKLPQTIKPILPTPKFEDDIFSDQNWNPYEEMQRMQDEMEQVFNQSFSRFHHNSPLGAYGKIPDLDLQEKSDSYVVTINVPGADESSLNVKLEEQILHISVKTEHIEDSNASGKYKQQERFRGEFHRSLRLPSEVQEDKMKTDYRNGVLTITIPKKVNGTPV